MSRFILNGLRRKGKHSQAQFQSDAVSGAKCSENEKANLRLAFQSVFFVDQMEFLMVTREV